MCGGRFYFIVFRSLSTNLRVKELLKSVHICQSYRKNKSGTFLWATVYSRQYGQGFRILADTDRTASCSMIAS